RRRHAHEHPAVEHGACVVQRPAGRADRRHAAGRAEGISGGARRRVPTGALRAEVTLTTPVSVGIHVPSSAVSALGSGEAYAEFYRQVETLGLDAVWTEDRIFHAANMLDPLMLLASAAASTRRIQLGTAVLVLTLRGGRLALGVSLGGRPEEYAAAGVPMARRVAVFRESVTVLRRLLAGEPVEAQGEFCRLQQATVRPPAPVPLYVGGNAEGALRRAGELADGWIMGPFGTLRDFAPAWRVVQDAARAAGRNANALVAGRLVYVAVDDHRGRARDAPRAFLHGYYGSRCDVDESAIFGPPGEVAARLAEHVEAGITRLMLGIPTLES